MQGRNQRVRLRTNVNIPTILILYAARRTSLQPLTSQEMNLNGKQHGR